MVSQVGLLPAGSQPWNSDVCAASGDRFAYCATLAIYVYEYDRMHNRFRLASIMSEHTKTILALTWNPRNPNLFASAGFDNKIIIWDVTKQKPVAIMEDIKKPVVAIGWNILNGDSLSYISHKGPLFLWSYQSTQASVSSIKDSTFSADVRCFRWHPKKMEKVAFGHSDGTVSFTTIGSKSLKHVLKPESEDDDDDDYDNAVVALEWDPLSMDYLLLSNLNTGIRLVDSVSLSVIMNFKLSSAATQVKTLSWLNSAPGMFITGDALSGILRVWNVSKSTPVENIRVKRTGFHVLKVICDIQRSKPLKSSPVTEQHRNSQLQKSSTSQAQEPTTVTASYFAMPPAQIVCTFCDGGIGLYNLGRRKWEFIRDQGHVETIFDCKFSPSESSLLATGSFDGTIKVWDIGSFECKSTSPGNEGIIYSLSWAPADLNCVVAGTSKCGMFIWDIGKGRIIKRFMEHGRSSVYTVCWNQRDSKRIMSTGGDGYCVIRQINGELIQKYRHPASVYGCDWSPHNKDMLATGCEDCKVRVYYTATAADQPLKVFSGHTAKVFHVKWSPLKENLLCSGSDDKTIRVWDYSQEACINTLIGHTGPVRGLLWNTEIPYMVISGSWDNGIRIWDVRDGRCLDKIQDHGADVYGLTSHPMRPFIVASSSRDSTVRLWSLSALVQPLELNILAQKPWEGILTSPDNGMSMGAPPLLTGRMSKMLRQEAEEYPADLRKRVLRLFSKFFRAPAGTNNLWDLVCVIQGLDDTLLPANYCKGIMHAKHLTKFHSSDAQYMEISKLSTFGGVGIGAPSKEERLREAAMLHMKSGNLQRYCELMIELGEWERAVALSPGVSMSYWKSLASRYAKYLISEDKDLAAPYCSAIGDSSMLTSFFCSRGEFGDAVLTAQVACEGMMHRQTDNRKSSTACNGLEEPSPEHIQLLQETVEQMAEWHHSNGSPVLSACCYLAVDDCQAAISRLIQGNELELAVAVGLVLGNLHEYTSVALELLSRRAEHLNRWELAIDLLQLIPNNQLLLAKCCARWKAEEAELNKLHQKAHLPSVRDCFIEAEKLKRKNNPFECVMFYLLSHSPECGLELGLEEVKRKLTSGDWTVDEVQEMVQLLGCIRSDVLSVHRKKGELLAITAYVGAFLAIRRGYDPVVPALFQQTRRILLEESHIDFGVTESMIQSELSAWNAVATAQPRKPINMDIIPSETRGVYRKLLARAGVENHQAWRGPDCMACSHLPSHSDVHESCLTATRIQGLAYFLEDGKSAISPNEALMWAKVNPFSPLNSGLRISPF